MFATKPGPALGLTLTFPFPPCGIERVEGLADIEKSVTESVNLVLLVVAPSGVPVTVAVIPPTLSGVDSIVLIVSVLETPAVVGVKV